jgi:hypothetical protein
MIREIHNLILQILKKSLDDRVIFNRSTAS